MPCPATPSGARAVARHCGVRVCSRCPDVMTVHSDTTCESARYLHADGFQNHTSNGLSHATHARSRHHKTNSNSSHAHAQNRQVRVNSLVRVANPPTCMQHRMKDTQHCLLQSRIYRALHNSVERDKERTVNIMNLNVSALPGSSLTSWTFVRAVLNSLSFLT